MIYFMTLQTQFSDEVHGETITKIQTGKQGKAVPTLHLLVRGNPLNPFVRT